MTFFGADPSAGFDAVKKAFRQFVEGDSDRPGRPSDLMMLVVFATRPETACPLTLDHQASWPILDAQEARKFTRATSR